MKILAIETSCDETGLAIIDAPDDINGSSKVLLNLVRSQIEQHKEFGGVVPNIAKREHERVLPLMWEEAKRSGVVEDIDMVAVTEGPGLEPCLWRGIEFAKQLSVELNAPLFGINHLKGHVYIVTLENELTYPLLSLIVSGGHTELVVSKKRGHFEIIGETVDDAAGEAFDKVARLLGLGYPGGPEISRVEKEGDDTAYPFPRPMEHSGDYNFSFAGLKTAVMYMVKGIKPQGAPINIEDKRVVANVAASFQKAAVDVLVSKTLKALHEFSPSMLVLGGGVAANTSLREELSKRVSEEAPHVKLLLPEVKHTTDNALMIALAAWQENDLLAPASELSAKANLRIGAN